MKLVELKQPSRECKKPLEYILDAWDEATLDGVQSDVLATAALFTALSALVDNHGEEAISELATRLSRRIKKGEFSIKQAARH